MGFLDKAKQAAQEASAKAKEGVADVQTKRDLGKAYTELGEKTFELADSGEVNNPALTDLVNRIRALKAQVDESGEPAMAGAAAGTTASAEPPPSDAPPAMPT
jgi:hypothetical protein